MVRPLRAETERYGEYSKPGEFVWDHPFQWGSRRIGPDLHRVGGKYANLWHFLHLDDPRSTSPGSLMPGYDFLRDGTVDLDVIAARMKVLQRLGVPYSEEELASAVADAQGQAQEIVDDLAKGDVVVDANSEMIALIAYLQRLGRGPQYFPDGQAQALLEEGN